MAEETSEIDKVIALSEMIDVEPSTILDAGLRGLNA
jgi:hypothetical protein